MLLRSHLRVQEETFLFLVNADVNESYNLCTLPYVPTVGARSERTVAEKTEKLIFRAFFSAKMRHFLFKGAFAPPPH